MHRAGIRTLGLFVALIGCQSRSTPAPEPVASSLPATPSTPDLSASSTLSPGLAIDARATSLNLFADGYAAYLSWIEPTPITPTKERKGGRILFSKYASETWQAPIVAAEDERLLINWADVPFVAKSPSGFVVGFSTKKGAEGIFAEIAVSTDDGKTFVHTGPVHEDRTETEHGFLSLLPVPNAVRLFWLDGRATANAKAEESSAATRLYTAVVRENRVVEEQLLDDRVCDCCALASVMTPDGPLVAYRDRSENEVRDVSIVRFDGNSFSKPQRVYEDDFRIAGCPVNGPALASSGARVALAWYTYAKDEGRIKLVFSSDAGKTFGAPIDIAGPKGKETPLGRVSVALLENGDAVVSFVVAEREDARFVLQRITPEGKKGSPLVVGSMRADRTSGFPKMVRLDDRLLVAWMAWMDDASPTLRTKTIRSSEIPAVVELAVESPQSGSEATPTKRLLAAGETPKALELTTLDGKTISLEGLRGKTVLVNLWGTYCEPCRQEIPILTNVYKSYLTRGLEVLGISMDREKKLEDIRKFVQKREIPYLMAWDSGDRAGDVFGVQINPASFLINPQGQVVWAHQGTVSKDDPTLRQALEKTLGPAIVPAPVLKRPH